MREVPPAAPSPEARAFEDAERALLAEYGVRAESRSVRLADPALTVRVLETGAGEPLVLVHGSGMSAPAWAPTAVSLPGMKADPFFRAMTTPGVRALVRRMPPPRSAAAARRAMRGAMGRPVTDRLPDTYFDVVRTAHPRVVRVRPRHEP